MRVPRLPRSSVALLTGGLAAGLVLLAPAEPVAATSSAAAATARQPLNIVVLGDSYSAGNGATDDAGQPQTYGPTNCYRSKVGWAEKYAASLRTQGYTVTVDNHACSGGKAADIIKPRVMDTATGNTTPTPAGVTTLEQADSYLVQKDLCNTKMFPAEEFWTYHATAIDSTNITYDCSRNLKPQADYITPDTDLVLFTMGGNDAGFANIVTQCFVMKSGSGCQGAIDAARKLLPSIKSALLDDVAGIRAAGLRDDAKIVQLGYPYLQTDNGYVVPVVPPPLPPASPTYAAGDAVRSLIDDGTTALASVATDADATHPGQMSFVSGIKEAFAGHEPDATTPVGNMDRWVNQVGDGTNTSLWYHPNGLGQTAYATVLLKGGDYGATPQSPLVPPTVGRIVFRAAAVKQRIAAGSDAVVRTSVRNTDGTVPRGTVLVRVPGGRTADQAPVASNGRNVLRVHGLQPGSHRIKAVYIGKQARMFSYVTVTVSRR